MKWKQFTNVLNCHWKKWMLDHCYCGCCYCCWGHELTYSHVAWGAGRLDIPQGLHEGGIHLAAVITDREVLEERSRLHMALDRRVETASKEVVLARGNIDKHRAILHRGESCPSVGIEKRLKQLCVFLLELTNSVIKLWAKSTAASVFLYAAMSR